MLSFLMVIILEKFRLLFLYFLYFFRKNSFFIISGKGFKLKIKANNVIETWNRNKKIIK